MNNLDNLPILYPTDWKEYELIDSGEGQKLERFGDYNIARPDPRALWQKSAATSVWENADASFIRTDSEHGDWQTKREPPADWRIHYDTLTFILKPASFKHVGVFPEQAPNWRWIGERVAKRSAKVLNLFAYTGGATLAAAAAGAEVTHVDSSKPSLDWAHENADASNLGDKPIRWILEDAYKFVVREGRRGTKYDAIIMDPPRFGRGAKGEVWKIEDDLPKLLAACKPLLVPTPLFFLLNAYTVDLSSIALRHLVTDLMGDVQGKITSGELALKDTTSEKLLPNGVFARWQRD